MKHYLTERGSQGIKEIRTGNDMMVHVELMYGYDILMTSEETELIISKLTDAMLALEAAKRAKNSS